MSLAKNNRLGAGDGIALQLQAHKRRVQVSSARKFATRGVAAAPNADIKLKLQTALSELRTAAPGAALRRRSLSMADMPHKSDARSNNNERPALAPGAHLQSVEAATVTATTAATTAAAVAVAPATTTPTTAVAASDGKTRRADAGRRVCHQLVLNAWRRRRAELASTVESHDRLRAQVDQLILQVLFLQHMRSNEMQRCDESLVVNKRLQLQLDEAKNKKSLLRQRIEHLQAQVNSAEENATNMNVCLMNERNVNDSLRMDIKQLSEELADGRTRVEKLAQEVQQHMKQIFNFEANEMSHRTICHQYEDTIRISDEKYLQLLQNHQTLQADFYDLQQQNEEISKEKQSIDELLAANRNKTEKLDVKLCDTKKQLATVRQQRKRTQEENEDLHKEIERLKSEFQAQNDRQWWLKTGDFLFEKFKSCAYIVFPALPRVPSRDVYKQLIVLDNCIAMGTL